MNEDGTKSDTKQRILDTAESLFARQGVTGTSLRQIIGEAKVNLAAIHYHFQSKEALVEALLLKRLTVVNKARLDRLDEYERDGNVPNVEQVLQAFLEPTLLFLAAENGRYRLFPQFMGRVHSELADLLPKIFQKHFQTFLERFRRAFGRALPDLPAAELQWRVFFCIGAMAYTLMHSQNLAVIAEGPSGDRANLEEASGRLIQFLAAGLRAPLKQW